MWYSILDNKYRICYSLSLMKLTITEFNIRFPEGDSCLEYLRQLRWPSYTCPRCERQDMLWRIKRRNQYACACGHHVSPLAGTIFHKSSTDLRIWFLAIYLMGQTRNGMSAMEFMRLTGVTYKCAWRILQQIRSVMDTTATFTGDVETDETFFAAKPARNTRIRSPKREILVGLLERSTGRVVTRYIARSGVAYRRDDIGSYSA